MHNMSMECCATRISKSSRRDGAEMERTFTWQIRTDFGVINYFAPGGFGAQVVQPPIADISYVAARTNQRVPSWNVLRRRTILPSGPWSARDVA